MTPLLTGLKQWLGNFSYNDKHVEKRRYDSRAFSLTENSLPAVFGSSASSLSPVLRAPYIKYEQVLLKLLPTSPRVLELCSGMGENTSLLVAHSKHLVASDISSMSLDVLQSRFSGAVNLETLVCDMEELPFPHHSFDLVACAGGLSYSDNILAMNQILRVLKPGGHFVCVDSLNHNPVYIVNRFFHYLRGRRSFSTLVRMPSFSLIARYRSNFAHVTCYFYGALSWLMVPLSLLLGQNIASSISNGFDNFLNLRLFAFKFVMVSRKGLV